MNLEGSRDRGIAEESGGNGGEAVRGCRIGDELRLQQGGK